MSEFGPPSPYTQPYSQPLPPPRSSKASWILLLCILLFLGGAGVLVYSLATNGDDGPSYPKHWDSRILPYVKIVEKERGLTFEHPVAVRFVDAKTFEKGVRADDSDLSADDRKELDRFAGELRALGLVNGKVDLFKAFNDAHGSGTLAYYSFETRSVTVRGTTITPAMKSTLVHELTHALQDQRFDAGYRTKKLAKANDKSTSTASDVFDAIVEGDAKRVETKYRDSLSAAGKKALDKSQQQEYDDAQDGLSKVPDVVLAIIGAPYTLGESMLHAADVKGGNAEVDKLFVDPPKHDKALLDPFETLAGEDNDVKVSVPKTPTGGTKFDSGEFGAVSLYLVLAARLPMQDALDAALGWGNDAYVAYDKGGTTCMNIDVQGETAKDTTRLFNALSRWVDYDPRATSRVVREGDHVAFSTCDPGNDAKPNKKVSQQAVELAAIRTYLGATFMKAGAPAKSAGCISTKLVDTYTPAQLVDPKFGANDPKVIDKVRQFSASCS